MNLSMHPAPGLNELLPGWYSVPQNPFDQSNYGVTRVPTLGEILPGSFAVPENPVGRFALGRTTLIGQGLGCGCGCGGSGACGKINGAGMGDLSQSWGALTGNLSSGNFMDALQVPIFSVPAWAWLAGGGLFLYMFMFAGPGASRYRRSRAGARAYRKAYTAEAA